MAEITEEVEKKKDGFFTKLKNIWKKISVPLATAVLALITIRRVSTSKKIKEEKQKITEDKKEIKEDTEKVIQAEQVVQKDLSDITQEIQAIKASSEKENQELSKFLPGLNK